MLKMGLRMKKYNSKLRSVSSFDSQQALAELEAQINSEIEVMRIVSVNVTTHSHGGKMIMSAIVSYRTLV